MNGAFRADIRHLPHFSWQFAASALISLGGIMGFVTKQSVPSLLAGGGSGALLAYGVRRQRADPRDVYLIVGESGCPCAATFFLKWPQRQTDDDFLPPRQASARSWS